MEDLRPHDAQVARRGIDIRLAITLALTAALGVAGFLVAGTNARSATQADATVSLRTTKLGAILVNSKGHTLYLFAKDKNDKSSCTAACANFWPPLIVQGKPTAGPGVKAPLLGITRRSNGSRQVTYNRHPLYTYTLDKQAGRTNGEGISAFGAKWWGVSAKGTAVTEASTTTTTGTTTTTPYGYP